MNDFSAMSQQSLELLQRLVRNAAVNDGTPDSGQELTSVRTLQAFLRDALEQPGVVSEIVEPHAGRASLIARIPGRDPNARSLCLLGHIDVVSADAEHWRHDPFGGELIDGEVWGRGTIDMLTLTAAMATVFRHAADPQHRPEGDLVLAAVADEESGGRYGAEWISEHRPDLLRTDEALTEQGGVLLRPESATSGITVGIGEKGQAARRLVVTGVPGHGSVPWGSRNAAGIAAEIVLELLQNPAPPVVQPHWVSLVHALQLDADLTERLLDPARLDGALPALGPLAPLGHALTRVTVSPNIVRAGEKHNVIPGTATVDLDIRVLPGQTPEDVDGLLERLLKPWSDCVRITGDQFSPGNITPTDTAMYARILKVFRHHYPDAVPASVIGPGGSDGRFLRPMGTNVYGFGLFSKQIDVAEFRRRLHGNDERVDVESVRLTTTALAELVFDRC